MEWAPLASALRSEDSGDRYDPVLDPDDPRLTQSMEPDHRHQGVKWARAPIADGHRPRKSAVDKDAWTRLSLGSERRGRVGRHTVTSPRPHCALLWFTPSHSSFL